MSRRLLTLFALPLLLAAVLLVWAQAFPGAAAALNAEPVTTGLGDRGVGVGSAADLLAEEPEPLQATALTPHTAAERGPWCATARSAWPVRAPDPLLRPPMPLAHV